jgi:hypothetical protein
MMGIVFIVGIFCIFYCSAGEVATQVILVRKHDDIANMAITCNAIILFMC